MDLPAQLGPYRVLGRLGQGGMAEVHLALAFGASGFEKQVVLKTLRPELRGDAELERLLIEEARLGARLSHRNLVGVHDLGCDGGIYYVRMDHVAGEDLGRRLARGRPEPALALYLVEELAHGLAYAHEATDDAGRPLGLVHRDVSPGNVLLSRAGEVKLTDFGVAKATMLADVTRANVRKGKYAYMSPEQIAGGAIGPASDQFALGVLLVELLTGARPFDGQGPLETMERIQKAEPPALAGFDAPVVALVHRCLAREARDRFPSVRVLLGALGAVRRAAGDAGPLELAAWLTR